MYKRILVATDGSALAMVAVEHGVELAITLNAIIVFTTVTDMWLPLETGDDQLIERITAIEVYEQTVSRLAMTILEAAQLRATERGLEARVVHVCNKTPAEGIVEAADQEDANLIVMASLGRRGLRKMLLGSATAEVLVSTTRPVLVLR